MRKPKKAAGRIDPSPLKLEEFDDAVQQVIKHYQGVVVMLSAWNNEEVLPKQLSRVPVVPKEAHKRNDRHVVKWSCTMHSWKCVKCHRCCDTV